MTADEIYIARSLATCRYLPGSAAKKFAKQMADRAKKNSSSELTETTKARLYGQLYSYRGQLPLCYLRYKNHYLCKPKPKSK